MNQHQYRAHKVKVAQIWRDLKISKQKFSRLDVDLTTNIGGWSLDSDKISSETEEEQDESIPSGVAKFVIRKYTPPADKSWFPGLNGLDLEQNTNTEC